MRKIKRTLPFIILITFLCLLARSLYSAAPEQLSSQFSNGDLPSFNLPSIFDQQSSVSSRSLRGRVTLLNIWASWCSACASEHAMLMRIKNVYHVPIYGILYKDSPSRAASYLSRNGNPYVQVGYDSDGSSLDAFNLYGTPETFVVGPSGEILYRQTGAMNEMTWETILYPIIKHYQDQE